MAIKRVDQNQKAIVAALRTMGCTVAITSKLGFGFPDLVILLDKIVYLIEIKNGIKPKSAQKLTPHEQKFHDNWKKAVIILNSIESAVEFVNLHRRIQGS